MFMINACFRSRQMVEESALLDLKHLLMEAQQRVPPVLMALEDPDQEMDEVCSQTTRFSFVADGGSVAWHFAARVSLKCATLVLFVPEQRDQRHTTQVRGGLTFQGHGCFFIAKQGICFKSACVFATPQDMRRGCCCVAGRWWHQEYNTWCYSP